MTINKNLQHLSLPFISQQEIADIPMLNSITTHIEFIHRDNVKYNGGASAPSFDIKPLIV